MSLIIYLTAANKSFSITCIGRWYFWFYFFLSTHQPLAVLLTQVQGAAKASLFQRVWKWKDTNKNKSHDASYRWYLYKQSYQTSLHKTFGLHHLKQGYQQYCCKVHFTEIFILETIIYSSALEKFSSTILTRFLSDCKYFSSHSHTFPVTYLIQNTISAICFHINAPWFCWRVLQSGQTGRCSAYRAASAGRGQARVL